VDGLATDQEPGRVHPHACAGLSRRELARAAAVASALLEPISAIIDAFRTHDVVALGEGRHNNEQGYAFRLALIRDPRFAATVNDIVVESGSSTHQDVMAVRTLNASLPPERKLRVLLGDPPFDWVRATREESTRIGLRRDPFAADLIQREVLSKQHRARVIYGDTHFLRRPPLGGSSLVTRLVAARARVLNIWTHTAAAHGAAGRDAASRHREPDGTPEAILRGRTETAITELRAEKTALNPRPRVPVRGRIPAWLAFLSHSEQPTTCCRERGAPICLLSRRTHPVSTRRVL